MRTPDLPIPAPSRWAMIRPTDAPVLAADWHALRNIEQGVYSLGRFAAAGLVPNSRAKAVVDDHGDLVLIGPDLEFQIWAIWACSEDFEAAGTQWWEAKMAESRAIAQREAAARLTRALLRPPPVRATLDHESALYPDHAATVDISADVRTDAPTYRISCEHQVLVLTHAQLAALMLAGQALCAQASRPAGAALQ